MGSLAQEMADLKSGKPIPLGERDKGLKPLVRESVEELEEKYRERVRELHNFADFACGRQITWQEAKRYKKEWKRLGDESAEACQALWDRGVSKDETLKMWKEEKNETTDKSRQRRE